MKFEPLDDNTTLRRQTGCTYWRWSDMQ